jgi:hypothetical protein
MTRLETCGRKRHVVSSLLCLALAMATASCGGGGGVSGTDDVRIFVEPTSGPPGTRIAYTLIACPNKHPLLHLWHAADINKAIFEGEGRGAKGTIVVPTNTPPGDYVLFAECPARLALVSADFTVTS